MERYRCPECKVVIEVDRLAKTKRILLEGIAPRPGEHRTMAFPSHPGCPLALPLDKIDYKKLERIE